MLHLPDPNLMRAMSRYHADGQIKDRHAHHAYILTQIRKQERRDRWALRWAALRGLWVRVPPVPETCRP